MDMGQVGQSRGQMAREEGKKGKRIAMDDKQQPS